MKFLILSLFALIGVAWSAHLGKAAFKSQNTNGGLGIIDGKTVKITEYPFMSSVSIDYMLDTAGVLVDKNWLLVRASDVQLYIEFFVPFVGSNKLEQGQKLEFEKIVFHPKYEGNFEYDAALLKLTKPLKLTKKVNIIELATDDLPAGTVGTTAGWGVTEELTGDYSKVLRATNNTVLDDASCQKVYGSWFNDKIFCLKVEKAGPCSGDFGGPFIVNNKLYGTFSGFLYDCTAYPRVYIKISTIADWVKKTIKGH